MFICFCVSVNYSIVGCFHQVHWAPVKILLGVFQANPQQKSGLYFTPKFVSLQKSVSLQKTFHSKKHAYIADPTGLHAYCGCFMNIFGYFCCFACFYQKFYDRNLSIFLHLFAKTIQKQHKFAVFRFFRHFFKFLYFGFQVESCELLQKTIQKQHKFALFRFFCHFFKFLCFGFRVESCELLQKAIQKQ